MLPPVHATSCDLGASLTGALHAGALRRMGFALILTVPAFALTASLASGQNIWAGNSSYQNCKRHAAQDFQNCLRTSAVSPPGARYAACSSTWKNSTGICWTNYKIELANRRGTWNPSPGISKGPLYRSSPAASSGAARSRLAFSNRNPRYTPARYQTAMSTRSSKVVGSYRTSRSTSVRTVRSSQTKPHQSGGIIRDPPR